MNTVNGVNNPYNMVYHNGDLSKSKLNESGMSRMIDRNITGVKSATVLPLYEVCDNSTGNFEKKKFMDSNPKITIMTNNYDYKFTANNNVAKYQ